ncbi:hypothetical protein SAMD00019534_074720 [Acytostelium subglobosum LB1]|uniref:hypothetical protein n=1 Tax=Acytostelium subglobosum LB1 TaxID=1410327 RepID=UPI000644B7B7|nr:hypothetical protein SAMD00019534_074720 [Acytostelium subglobosum LB1]GAM24297.1 hypothetical protein SAMD00019534_074720 [Acytostelium subglobosum LB1]|eukprot:XP_012752623.1 hypothetical protein SAMD00019534_074720 [Acytostelium subglobosum LB1]
MTKKKKSDVDTAAVAATTAATTQQAVATTAATTATTHAKTKKKSSGAATKRKKSEEESDEDDSPPSSPSGPPKEAYEASPAVGGVGCGGNDPCQVCTSGAPSCLMSRLSWSTILWVVFYSLKKQIKQREFFSLRRDVYGYVLHHWDMLCPSKNRQHNWKKQIQDALSHSPFFLSGQQKVGCNGYWKLKKYVNPWSVPKNTTLEDIANKWSDDMSPEQPDTNNNNNNNNVEEDEFVEDLDDNNPDANNSPSVVDKQPTTTMSNKRTKHSHPNATAPSPAGATTAGLDNSQMQQMLIGTLSNLTQRIDSLERLHEQTQSEQQVMTQHINNLNDFVRGVKQQQQHQHQQHQHQQQLHHHQQQQQQQSTSTSTSPSPLPSSYYSPSTMPQFTLQQTLSILQHHRPHPLQQLELRQHQQQQLQQRQELQLQQQRHPPLSILPFNNLGAGGGGGGGSGAGTVPKPPPSLHDLAGNTSNSNHGRTSYPPLSDPTYPIRHHQRQPKDFVDMPPFGGVGSVGGGGGGGGASGMSTPSFTTPDLLANSFRSKSPTTNHNNNNRHSANGSANGSSSSSTTTTTTTTTTTHNGNGNGHGHGHGHGNSNNNFPTTPTTPEHGSSTGSNSSSPSYLHLLHKSRTTHHSKQQQQQQQQQTDLTLDKSTIPIDKAIPVSHIIGFLLNATDQD